MLAAFRVSALTDMRPNVISPGVAYIKGTPDYMEGSPYVLMVDPEGMIQGHGLADSIDEVLEFVSEGAAHGHEPGLVSAVDGHRHPH